MRINKIPYKHLEFFFFKCRNLDQKREWTLQLKRVILENYNATIPAHARQLVMELGQAKSNGKSWSCCHKIKNYFTFSLGNLVPLTFITDKHIFILYTLYLRFIKLYIRWRSGLRRHFHSDLSASDWRGGGKKVHHAPEYLERRKDRRRASETGLNARLRIRRSSRARKSKEEVCEALKFQFAFST